VAQEALWYLSLLVPNQFSYNEAISIRKDGPFDVDAFRRAFNEIVRRHEAWHTTFDTVGGAPVQILQPGPAFDLPVLDLSHLSLEAADRQAVRLAAQVSRVPYDLRRGPLLRPRLVKFPGDHHRLYLAMHHLVFDGVSVYRVILPELVALYDAFSAGQPSPLAEPSTSYADYARWEQQWMTEPRAARRLDHWRRHLADAPALALPLDHDRPTSPHYRGGVIPLSVAAKTVAGLREVGQTVGATMFQVVATVWSLLLSRYSGQPDVVFATAADLRQRAELESVVGYSLTPLVLRIDLSGDPSFVDLVVRVRNELLDGLDNLVPFERLVRELPPGVSSSANPIYQTMFILEPPTVAPDLTWSIHQMESEIGDAVGSTKLDLELELDERPDGHIAGRLIYDRDLFERSTATRMVEHWLGLIDAVAADPTVALSRIPILTPDEEHRQLVEWNATATARPCGAVHELVARRAARRPDAPALSAGGETVSYAELDDRARGVADLLLAAGVPVGAVVALYGELSIDLVAATLGVLKAGAAYLLLDPALAVERLDLLLADSGAVALLAAPVDAARLTARPELILDLRPTDFRGPDGPGRATDGTTTNPEAVCCVHYRSTGPHLSRGDSDRPTGVLLQHQAVVNLAAAMADDLGIGSADTVLILPSTFFQVPVLDLWMGLGAGARIVAADRITAGHGGRLNRLIAAERVSFLHGSPTTWRDLIDSGLKSSRALAALSGGEELSRELADRLLDRCRVLWNAYGSAETTFYSTMGRVERSTPVTIGRPMANTQVYVLDDHGHPVPVGVTGDLVVAGDGVAAASTSRANLVDANLVDDPFGLGTAWRTGDRARWSAEGELTLVRTGHPSGAQPSGT
jgi:non-ribosomal peptide synthetase component F